MIRFISDILGAIIVFYMLFSLLAFAFGIQSSYVATLNDQCKRKTNLSMVLPSHGLGCKLGFWLQEEVK